jgi:hypothetical protein
MNGYAASAASTVCVLNGAAYFARSDAENLRSPAGVCRRTRISGSITPDSLRGNGARMETV